MLRQYGCETGTELKTLLASQQEALAEQGEKCTDLAAQLDTAEKTLKNAQAMQGLFVEWEQARERVAQPNRRGRTKYARWKNSAPVRKVQHSCCRSAREVAALQQQWKVHEEKAAEAAAQVKRLQSRLNKCVAIISGYAGALRQDKVKKTAEKNAAEEQLKQAGERISENIFYLYGRYSAYAQRRCLKREGHAPFVEVSIIRLRRPERMRKQRNGRSEKQKSIFKR